MRRLTILLVAAVASSLASCPGPTKNVECVDSTNCDLHAGGVCTVAASGNQWCSYPDSTCPSGLRYSDLDVGDGLGGVCVTPAVDAAVDGPIDAAIDGGEIDGPGDITPPIVESVTPLDLSTTAGTGAAVTATFSEPILAATTTPASFRVQMGAMMVPGNVVANGTLVSFMPSIRLSPSTTYQVTLTTAITDLAGNHLAAQYQWSFTTSAGGWTTGALLETNNADAAGGLVVSFSNGHGIAAWSMGTGPWFAEYSGGAWSAGAAVPALAGAGPEAVVADGQGHFMMILGRTTANVKSLEASRYVGGAWSAPVPLETDAVNNVLGARASGDAAGNVVVVWAQGGTQQIFANRYVVGTGWSGAARVNTGSVTAYDPAVALHSDGTATAVWNQGGPPMFFASRFTAASGWSAPVPVGGTATAGTHPEIAIAGDGVPTAIWRDGTALRASRFIGAWTSPTAINGATGAPYAQLALAASPAGRVVALWLAGPTGFQSVYQAVYTAGTGWGPPTAIDVLAGATNYPDLTFGQGEQAIATWTQPQGAAGNPSGAWSNLFAPATGWGDPQLVTTDANFSVTSVHPFYDSSANMFGAVWLKTTANPTSVYEARLQ